jgi:hypothetical protein
MLAQRIFFMCSAKVGLHWRPISVGKGISLKKEQLVFAIHVEVDARFEQMDRHRMEDLYSTTLHGEFPLGIKLRLIPLYSEATIPSSAAELDRMRLCQAAFIENVRRDASDDILVLDFEDEHQLGGITMRDLIMNIKSANHPTENVFVSVDKHFRGHGVMYQYTSHFHYEAVAMINGMLPYLLSKVEPSLHKQIKKCFSQHVLRRVEDSEWDITR